MSLNRRYCIAGIDLSRTTDLTSVCIMFKQQNDDRLFVLSQSWITEDCYNQQKMTNNRQFFDRCIKDDCLRISKGHIIDYHLILDYLDEIKEKYDLYYFKIGYDRYGATYLTQELKDKYGDDVLEEVIQGAKTESIPLQNLKAELQAKNLIYNNNNMLKWCLCNMRVKQDANANLQLTKNRNLTTRDDAAAALLDCMVVYLRNMEDYNNIC
jgi:phage terminase large subunit-like protein